MLQSIKNILAVIFFASLSIASVCQEANDTTINTSGLTPDTSMVTSPEGGGSAPLSPPGGGGDCPYTVFPGSKTYAAAGGTESFDVEMDGDCSWMTYDNQAWISSSPGGAGSGSFTVTCQANSSTSQRSGTVTVSGEGLEDVNVTIIQVGKPATPPTPTATYNCGNTVLTRGTPPTGITYYWQGTSCGTSTSNSSTTYTVTSAGTYYLRARNTYGDWSTNCASIAVTVNEIPATPGTPTLTYNCGNTVLTRGTPPSGITWYWQGTSCGTSTSNSSTTYTVTTPGTYYLRARNNTSGCWSTSCANVAVTVNEIPATPSTPTLTYNCGNTVLTRGTPPSGITWYWQGTSCGTSTSNSSTTYTVTTPGTYYLRARNNTSGCWSTSCANVAVTVNEIPATPSTPTLTYNCGNTVLTRGTPPSGITWYWQGTSCGTSTSNSSTTYTVTTPGTYYLRARNNTSGCWSTSCANVAVTVNEIPATPSTPTLTYNCGNTVLTRGTPPSGITWYWQGTTCGTSTSNSSTTYTVTTPGTYYLRARNNTSGCWSTSCASVAVTVNEIPATPSTPTLTYNCGNTVLTRGTPPSGITWYWQGTSCGTSTSNSSTTYTVTTPGTYYLRARNNTSGCWSTSCVSTFTEVYANCPTTPDDPDVTFKAGSTVVTRESSPSGSTYYWQTTSNGTSLSDTSISKTFTSSTTYYLRSRFNSPPNIWSDATIVPIVISNTYPLPDTNQNYILTQTPRVATTAASNLSTNKDSTTILTEFYDGLGRIIQAIQLQGSPTGRDFITPYTYDPYGRQDKSYLSFTKLNNTGNFLDDPISIQENFYGNLFGGDSIYAFSRAVFENSPLNRILKQGAPGLTWQPKEDSVENIIKFEYGSNVANEVRIWKVIDNNMIVSTVFYQQGQLYKNEVEDENGENKTFEYKDKNGKIILKESLVGSSRFQTYYIYDTFGLLKAVLPPKYCELGTESINTNDTSGNFFELGYAYDYDARNRMIKKKIPGAEPVYMVYDKRDRLVLTQDGNLRHDLNKKWMFIKYDVLNRPVLTGIITYTSSYTQTLLDSIIDAAYSGPSSRSYFVNRNTSDTVSLGYDTISYPNSGDGTMEYLTATYFDHYDFPNRQYFDDNVNISGYEDNEGNDFRYWERLNGQITGAKAKVLKDCTPQYITTTNYYDDRYRMIQSIRDMYLPGNELTSNKYDFSGKIIQSRIKQGSVTLNKYYNYDHADRLLSVDQEISGDTNGKVTVSALDYNELGQQSKKSLHVSSGGNAQQELDYKYNIRGWLESINNPDTIGNDLFAMCLTYEDVSSLGSLTKQEQYNGNISGIIWKRKQDGSTFLKSEYSYLYDSLNRLTNSYYAEGESLVPSEKFRSYNIGYDRNGNISKLKRKNQSGNAMDNLTYSFKYTNGNRLNSVTDSVPGNEGAIGSFNYDYDGNGNMISYQTSSSVYNLSYNFLNLPDTIHWSDVNNISYYYDFDANGRKLRMENDTGHRDYEGLFEYQNGQLDLIHMDEGIVTKSTGGYTYEYHIKDHLGNVRIVFAPGQSGPLLFQKTDYYPFGMIHENQYFNSTDNKYLYNGKELQEIGFEQWYDYGARFYDPALGRWHTPDPASEISRKLSPYQYAYNNPIRYIDPDGMVIDDYRLDKKTGEIEFIQKTKDDYDVLYASDDNGTINSNISIKVEKGVLGNKNTVTIPAQNSKGEVSNVTVDEYTVNGNASGKTLFEFAAKNSNVEWSQTIVGQETNYITTSESSNGDAGMDYEIKTKATDANPLIEANHSHPGNSSSPGIGDATVADQGLSRFPSAKFNIFTPSNGQYVPFTNVIPLPGISVSAPGRSRINSRYITNIPNLAKPINTELRKIIQ